MKNLIARQKLASPIIDHENMYDFPSEEFCKWSSDGEWVYLKRDRALELGFETKHVALLSYRGREGSSLTPFTQIGKHTLRSPIQGKYDEFGNPEYSEGEVTTDSVHRFKGQAAPCVVLTEIDFAKLDENTKIRIFVGATRATVKLILVLSKRSLEILLQRA